MITVGDYVIYGSNGVCRVADICEKYVSFEKKTYCVLIPADDEATSFSVPLENAGLVSRIHELVSRDEIIDIIKELPSVRFPWNDDIKMRGKLYEKTLSEGDRLAVLSMIFRLREERESLAAIKKKLRAVDAQALARAEKIIGDEFGTVLEIPSEQVMEFISATSKIAEE